MLKTVETPTAKKLTKVFVVTYDIGYRIDEDGRICARWMCTTDEEEAKGLGGFYNVANISDLHDWVCACGEVFRGIVQAREGLCVWVETTIRDPLTDEEDYSCEYQLLRGVTVN